MTYSPQRHKELENISLMGEFVDKENIWKEWLIEDEHSVQTKIDDMIFHHSVYKALRFENKTFKTPQLPNIVSHLLDNGYSEGQLLAIRRLCDSSSRNDYISIPRILDDIKNNAHLFTRYNYVCFDGAPFNFKAEEEIYYENKREQHQKAQVYSQKFALFLSKIRHKSFDKLLGIYKRTPQNTPDETLPVSNIVEYLKSHLGGCSKAEKVTNKYYAHSADFYSRESIPKNMREVTFEHLENCHKNLYAVANFIGSNLLIEEPVCLAINQFSVFEGFKKMGVSGENLNLMDDFVGCYSTSVEKYANKFENSFLEREN